MGAFEAPAGDLSGVFRRAGGSSEGAGRGWGGAGGQNTDEVVHDLAQEIAT